jgi:hypothetical protein
METPCNNIISHMDLKQDDNPFLPVEPGLSRSVMIIVHVTDPG